MGDGWFAFGLYEELSDVVGPIEFASDGPVDDKGPTEFGGRAGLVQGELVSGVAGETHELTASEMRGVIVRGQAAVVVDPVTGLLATDPSAVAVDPATGLVVDPAWNEDGTTGKPVEAPPRTGDPKSGTL